MIAVSNSWVNAHKETLLPETFLEITYSITEPGIQQAATSTGTGEISFSNAASVVDARDKFPEKYAALEGFGLDGTYEYFDGSPVDPGYTTAEMSDSTTAFAGIPTITITFPSVRTAPIPGVTITWSEVFHEWATEFRVSAWVGSTLLAQKTVTGNTSLVSSVALEMVDYNKITIEILKWSLPYRRARCEAVFLGIRTIYTKADLMGYTHTQTADLLSATLPKNEITFRLRNEDQRWNPDNPKGVVQYLLTRQEIRVRYGMTVDGATEWIDGGTFWLSGWETPANGLEASFTARDALEFMNEEYTGPRSGTLYNIAVAAFQQAEIPLRDDGSLRYAVHEGLKAYSTDFSADDSQYTIAEVIQMAAHAGNCTLHQDSSGVVRVMPWSATYSGYIIDPWISYTHPEYVISKPLKAVSVGYGDNQQRAVVPTTTGYGEVQTVDNVFLRTADDAIRVGKNTGELLLNRKVVSGEFRADARLEALDNIIVTSKYASNVVAVTEVSYSTTGGAFRGSYVGRVVSISLEPDDIRVNELYAGEV